MDRMFGQVLTKTMRPQRTASAPGVVPSRRPQDNNLAVVSREDKTWCTRLTGNIKERDGGRSDDCHSAFQKENGVFGFCQEACRVFLIGEEIVDVNISWNTSEAVAEIEKPEEGVHG